MPLVLTCMRGVSILWYVLVPDVLKVLDTCTQGLVHFVGNGPGKGTKWRILLRLFRRFGSIFQSGQHDCAHQWHSSKRT